MWEDLELDPERIPTFKLVFHAAQILFAFVAWCLEIVVFRAADSRVVGNNAWTFAVFFLSIPAWIYLLMAPRYPNTRKLAEPHVMCVVDGLFTILWLSAFATQAAYNTADLCGKACGASKAIVGLGFFVFLFFGVTTFLSIWTLKYYQWNNRLPGYDRGQPVSQQNIDPDKAAFSLAPHDEEAYVPVNIDDHDHDDHASSHYGGGPAPSDYSGPYDSSAVGGASTASGYQDSSFGQHEAAPANLFEGDTEYHSAAGQYASPTATDAFDDDARPARFPRANYDRIGGQ